MKRSDKSDKSPSFSKKNDPFVTFVTINLKTKNANYILMV
jgi:hypothetical protein